MCCIIEAHESLLNCSNTFIVTTNAQLIQDVVPSTRLSRHVSAPVRHHRGDHLRNSNIKLKNRNGNTAPALGTTALK